MIQTTPARPLALVKWLTVVALLIVAIVVVGGITRLTESGVSITEWNVVSGTLPPLSEAAWQAEFARYRQTPQFIEINGPAGMTLATYKFIFFWEWVHRLLARGIGLVFAAPLVWFWLRGQIPAGYKLRLVALLALGGLQGAVGWWMVQSGIVHDVKVSHFRLATHLLVALTTLAGVVWTALDLIGNSRGAAPARLRPVAALALGALAIQLMLGAWLAGLRAGVVAGAGWFNWDAWPLMQGRLWPAGIDWSKGAPFAFGHDPYLVHFLHRWWAWVVVAILVVLARQVRRSGNRPASIALHSAFGTQVLLGIATVWSGVWLPLAVLHQLTGALLVVATTWAAHALGRRA
ncbi:COX15/CtaA family protein [Novosphingobium sp. FSW06-99]|uniref:COX15/CtaA family protein n=1 Tax=Novosphingobium sp. FSW06-99 TaxID=1739113 RepID=UPI00076CE78C|nr:COX15/CtaA family protein [Novosphingobium sp. FSW06-99]KUR78249.1 heme A synthase [Novosphingobium sp. FSW06-99]